jgi:5-methyltetrahydropteroyltriglutamate--homocysteine methyltransferase
VRVHRFLLEYDDARSGSFAPLKEIPEDKFVVLGLISTKRPELESGNELKDRISEASRYVALERLGLSPQCGFASSIVGNAISAEDQRRKLELVVKTAQEVWHSSREPQ